MPLRSNIGLFATRESRDSSLVFLLSLKGSFVVDFSRLDSGTFLAKFGA